MGQPHIIVTYWMGLVVRAKQISVGINPNDGKAWVEVIPIDAKSETDRLVTGVSDVQSIEFEKGAN